MVSLCILLIMGKYIVKEYETNCPEYEYSEEFDSLELAQERMRELYHELAFENTPPEVIVEAGIDDRSAFVFTIDGNEIGWDIETF